MKKFALIILFTLFTAPAWATTYFLAPASGGGSDSNNGTSASTPWLSPNHSVNCGDVITAAAGTYSASNFNIGNWGTVTCPAGNNVAWLKCATFDACKISASGTQGMKVTASFWGVQGWEATGSGSYAGCFVVRPPGSATIHHIIFTNDIANGCVSGGFSAFNNGNASVDYIVFVGNIAYNAAQASDSCASGFNIYQPVKSDSVAGTHMYIAGNFAWKNLDPDPCAGGVPTDGEGFILDTFDGSQGGLPAPYDQQAVVYNNISLGNGGRGFQVLNNQSGSSHAHIFVYQNTSWGNETDANQNGGGASYGEFELSRTLNTSATLNIGQTTASTCCGGFALYAFMVASGNGTDSASTNWGYSAAGHNGGTQSSTGFSFGTNTFGTDPSFSSPSLPGAPSCGSATSVPNCMATVIANFTPTTTAAKAYGYQIPSTTQTSDPLFPQWLCNVNLPSGLVTMGCASSASSPAPPTNINVTVQ